MIAEVVQGFYDFEGKRISQPRRKRHPSFEGRPMGSFISQPLKVICKDMAEIRAFLRTCSYLTDQEQFGVRDYWARPEHFERTRRGDCDDFALWTWRQLHDLGYDARFVVGRAGRYGQGHAWVEFRSEGRNFILEPQLARYASFPRLDVLSYRPTISVEMTDFRPKFFEHARSSVEAPFRVTAPLVPEWLLFHLRRWLLWPYYLSRLCYLRKRLMVGGLEERATKRRPDKGFRFRFRFRFR